MNHEDLKLKLLSNSPIYLSGAGIINIPSVRTIIDIGLNEYNIRLSHLLIDKSYLKESIDNISNFDIFFANCYHNTSFRSNSFDLLRLYFATECSLEQDDYSISITIGDKGHLDHSNFDEFQEMISTAHNIRPSNEAEFKPGNSKAQEMVDMILKNRKKQPKPKEKMDLHSIISGLAWKSNGLNILNVFDLSIYQIYNGLQVTDNIDNYHHTLNGIYAGTIETKNIKISDLHWANKSN
ncbi:hypothetical protein GRF59_15210 [Paenibacillus sp. HJL G12]|uniref:Uncharacterized protein n=1 Tax=Paenibacillus dendrobii TaxID=2691084 RepID=A0A7X3ILP7_9BACL|nr:hypothetical protein [Paenibacillus dendrobii]MWV44970.1 hypothetical protein [Paenibacillus dendrobii]